MVVGSEDGTIRLYSERTLTRASTSIPGLGSPVTSVDVTYDGKWVVATTRNYLMVLKTTFSDDKTGKATNGFKARMGGTAPKPRLLRLKTEDVSRVVCCCGPLSSLYLFIPLPSRYIHLSCQGAGGGRLSATEVVGRTGRLSATRCGWCGVRLSAVWRRRY